VEPFPRHLAEAQAGEEERRPSGQQGQLAHTAPLCLRDRCGHQCLTQPTPAARRRHHHRAEEGDVAVHLQPGGTGDLAAILGHEKGLQVLLHPRQG
jgi:hypothetical protein